MNRIKVSDLKKGVNISTKYEFAEGKILYTKYLINHVMPKMVDVTEITHINFGTERATLSRTDKEMLVKVINLNQITDVYTPSADYEQYVQDGGKLNYRAYKNILRELEAEGK